MDARHRFNLAQCQQQMAKKTLKLENISSAQVRGLLGPLVVDEPCRLHVAVCSALCFLPGDGGGGPSAVRASASSGETVAFHLSSSACCTARQSKDAFTQLTNPTTKVKYQPEAADAVGNCMHGLLTGEDHGAARLLPMSPRCCGGVARAHKHARISCSSWER
jgi:hypothetical protein